MTRRARRLLPCFVALTLGCGAPPRIDTSSEAEAVASLKRVRQSLPQRKRQAFDRAVMTVASSRLGQASPFEGAGGPEAVGARWLAPLNGMTAAEVLTEARRIAAEKKEPPTPGRERSRPPSR